MKKWFAVMSGPDDDDWGTGAFEQTEAERMVVKNLDIYPDGYIAVIENDTCIDTLKPEGFSAPYMYASRIIKAHDWEEARDDLDSLMRQLGLDKEWAGADGDNFEAVIRKAGHMLGIHLA